MTVFHDFEIVVTPNPDAPEALQKIGEQYWIISEINPDLKTVQWAQNVSDIDHQPWSSSAYLAAAAAVDATVPTAHCSACDSILTLTSRAAVSEVLRERPIKCKKCTPKIDEHIKKILDPAAQARQKERAARKREEDCKRAQQRLADQKAREARQLLDIERQQVIADRYGPLVNMHSDAVLAGASIRAKIGALATIYGAQNLENVIHSVSFTDRRISPDGQLSKELFREAWSANLLIPDPFSDVEAFAWSEKNSTELAGGIFVEKMLFTVPDTGRSNNRVQSFSEELRNHISLKDMYSTQREELLDLAYELMVGEAVRFANFRLYDQNLPPLTEANIDKLRAHLREAAASASLGVLYLMVWRSVKDAAAAHTKHTRMSKENATTHSVTKVSIFVDQLLSGTFPCSKPFHESSQVPLSEATKIVFNLIMESPPMETEPSVLRNSLQEHSDWELLQQCDEKIPDREFLMEWLYQEQTWTAEQFFDALAMVSSSEFRICAPGCAHQVSADIATQVLEFHDRVSFHDDRKSAMLAAEATIIGNKIGSQARAGDFVLGEVITKLQNIPGEV